MKMRIVFSGLIGLVLMAQGHAASAVGLEPVQKDLDKDGFAESQIFYRADRKIEKIQLYSAHSLKQVGVVYYQDGIRSRAEFDRMGGDRTDMWISYTTTGEPYVIAEDRIGQSGRPNYWAYFQNNKVFMWKQDRNGDGNPDLVTILRYGADSRPIVVKQMLDDNYDGHFSKVSRRPASQSSYAANERWMPRAFAN